MGNPIASTVATPGQVGNDRKRAIIAYLFEGEVVSIIGVFYGGQDYEAALGSEDE